MVTAPGVDWVARSVGCRITDNVLDVVGCGDLVLLGSIAAV